MARLEQEFGKHIRSLRRARGLTQTGLAEAAGVSVDTVRRLEHGHFSASLGTMAKLSSGLGISLTTLLVTFEVGEALDDELADAIRRLPSQRRALALQLLGVLSRAGALD